MQNYCMFFLIIWFYEYANYIHIHRLLDAIYSKLYKKYYKN